MDEVTTLIGSLGFPIVACIYMAWFINNTMKKHTESMDKNNSLLEKVIEMLHSLKRGGEDD